MMLTGAARADTTAVYGTANGKFSMTIKIASNGDIHGEVPGTNYYFVGGTDYFVDRSASGVMVMRLDDVAKVMSERYVEMAAKIGTTSPTPPIITLVRKGDASIKQWSGEAYYMQSKTGQTSPRPVAVISHTASLAELGRAMQRQFEKSEVLMSQISGGRAPTSNLNEILRSGAPISFANAELQTVSFDPIPKSEFVLPARPASLEDVRKHISLH